MVKLYKKNSTGNRYYSSVIIIIGLFFRVRFYCSHYFKCTRLSRCTLSLSLEGLYLDASAFFQANLFFFLHFFQLQSGWMISAVFLLVIGITGAKGYFAKLLGPLTLSAAIILHGFNHMRNFPYASREKK